MKSKASLQWGDYNAKQDPPNTKNKNKKQQQEQEKKKKKKRFEKKPRSKEAGRAARRFRIPCIRLQK